MQKADGDAFDVLIQELVDCPAGVFFIQGDNDVAEHIGSLGHAPDAAAGNERVIVHMGYGVQAVGVGIA